MYRKQHRDQLSIEALHFPFGSTLDLASRWVLLAEPMPWQELEDAYTPQFSTNVCAKAKLFRLAFGSLHIKQHLGPKGEDTVLQIQNNSCI